MGFAILLVVLVILVGVLWTVFTSDNNEPGTPEPATIDVPSVYQLEETVAVRTLESAGFPVTTVRVPNADIPTNHVFDQQPRAGTKLAPGTPITLTISAGASAVPVPNVLGWQAIDAERALRGAGFIANLVQVGSARPAGEVLQQEPAPLVPHEAGAAVTLNISAGPSAILVPNVAGMDDVDAAVAITSAGLVVERLAEQSGTVAEGLVVRTEPAAGSQLAEGSQVLVYVSSGPEGRRDAGPHRPQPHDRAHPARHAGDDRRRGGGAPLPGETPGLIVSQDPVVGTPITPSSILTLYVTGEPETGRTQPARDELTPLEGDGGGETPPAEGGIDPSGLPQRPAPEDG